MNKIGRNSPCPCGSGKKFKRCCLEKETKIKFNTIPIENLDELSNHSIDLIKEGKLDEAEILATKLIKEFPELHDGLERMAMICEARKIYHKAEKYYKKAANVVNKNDGYEVGFADFLIEKAKKMESMKNEK